MRTRRSAAFDAEANLKRCARCRVFQPVSEFSISDYRNGEASLRSYCKPCAKLQRSDWYHTGGGRNWHKQYRKDNPEALAAATRRHNLKKHYGLSETDYEALLVAQGGVCALCKQPPVAKRLAVDHDHSTLRRRALLCGSCNTALGAFHDNPALLRQAADYVEGFRS